MLLRSGSGPERSATTWRMGRDGRSSGGGGSFFLFLFFLVCLGWSRTLITRKSNEGQGLMLSHQGSTLRHNMKSCYSRISGGE